MLHIHRPQALLLFVSSLIVAGGCTPKTQGEKMMQSFSETREITNKSRERVGKAMASLQNLRRSRGETMSDAYRAYKEAVSQLEVEDEELRSQANWVKQDAEAHIKAWEKEMETIKDAQIKSTLQDRQKAVRTNFTLIQMYADDARKRFPPFLQGNKELLKALAIDLSPAAVAALGPSMDKVDADGRALDERLMALQRGSDNIANGVSPLGLGV